MIFNKSKVILAALGLASVSSISAKETGENCPFSAKVWCITKGGLPCEDLYDVDTRPLNCGDRAVTMHYEYCNELSSNHVLAKAPRVEVKYRNNFQSVTWYRSDNGQEVDILDPMRGYECRKATHQTIINNCEKTTVTGSLKFEGNRLDENDNRIVAWDPVTGQANEDYCYAWGWYSEKIVRDATPSPTNSPTSTPTSAPTPFPTPFQDDLTDGLVSDPEPQPNVAPNLSMDISCKVFDNGSYSLDCAQMSPVMSASVCEKSIQYTYTVTNNSKFDAILQTVIGGFNSNLMNGSTAKIGTWSKSIIENVNVCERAGETTKKQATAIAITDGAVDTAACTGYASASYEYTFPSTNAIYKLVGISCMYENQACADYLAGNGCFSGEVDFIHEVQNVGLTCHKISQVSSSFKNLALEESNSCPNDIFDFVVKRDVTFCSGNRYDFGFDIDIFTSAGKAPVTSTIKIDIPEGITDSSPIPPKPKPPTLPPVPVKTEAPTKAPTKAPTLAPVPLPTPMAPVTTTVTAPGNLCEDHPTQLWLTFTSRTCTESSNAQFSFGRRRGLGQKSKYGGYTARTNSGKGIRRGLKHRSTGSGKGSKKSKKDDSKSNEEDKKKPSSNTKPGEDEDGGEGVVVDTSIEYSCSDYEIFGSDPRVMISITSINEEVLYWSGSNICEGTDIVIGDGISKIASEIKIKIYADSGNKGTKLHQQIIMHTACVTKAMSLGDIFGAIEVTGMRNGVQGLLGK